MDIPIQKLQGYLFSKLPAVWGITPAEYSAYGRCYRNQKDDGYVAEVYTGNREYREVYLDDTVSALSFFGISGDTELDIASTASVHLVFFVNLEKLKPAIGHRGDEEVRVDVLNLIKGGIYGFTVTEISTGIERVLQEYAGTTMAQRDNLDGLYARDMHPYHCFRFDFELRYNINNC
ncbi:hypothetical protein ACFOTA_06885 [Chitinophaga sp. GCM10012297]|uniref:Uncharacterized protein n=1 Tax=Chitinophaga chungangae TaxID=2821488 RepID=A0ABS3YB85_9BACT|nr:hypothetical protein [Chitinophaga chungangae]MBO9151924.1 hypothetical protein [Chitinophaga chungangae]